MSGRGPTVSGHFPDNFRSFPKTVIILPGTLFFLSLEIIGRKRNCQLNKGFSGLSDVTLVGGDACAYEFSLLEDKPK
jgi:hypothetical protein